MNKVIVCPVAFNENVKLKSVVERFLKSSIRPRADCLIVDDASTDGTTEVIQSYAAAGVKTIKHLESKASDDGPQVLRII